MIRKIEKNEIRQRIHKRIRRKVHGTTERPRLAIFRRVAHIYAQLIDDSKGQTLVSASSIEKAVKTNGGNVAAAKAIGKAVAERLQQDGFDIAGIISATRGNHGQSLALAAGRVGLSAVIVVPFGNSREKNDAMRAFGAELVLARKICPGEISGEMRIVGTRTP